MDNRFENDNVNKSRLVRKNLQSQSEIAHRERKEKESKRLSESIDKHFRTTFIGALSAFEKEFGDDWGGGYF